MTITFLSKLYSYIISVFFVILATLVRVFLNTFVGEEAPYLPFLVAILCASWLGGLRPGLLATVLGAVICTYVFVHPHFQMLDSSSSDKPVWFFIVLGLGGFISWVCESLHIARRIAEEQTLKNQKEHEQLQQSEERFRKTILRAPNPKILYTEDGKILAVSESWFELSGFSPRELTTIQAWTELAYGDSSKEVLAEIMSLFDIESNIDEGEFAIRTKSGETRIWDFSSSNLGKLPDGRRIAMSSAKDVTERKKTENKLRYLEERFESFMKYSPLVHWIKDEYGAYCYVNRQWEKFTNIDASHAIGKNDVELFPEEVAQQFIGNDRDVLTTDEMKQVIEKTGKHNDAERICTVWKFPFADLDGKRFIGGIAFDMTESIKASEDLNRLNSALEAAANGVVITDVKGTILWVNAAFEKYTGYTRHEAAGQNPRILKSFRQDGKFYENLWQTITSGEVWQGEICNRRKDGSLYYEEMTITPVRSANGTITNFVAIKQDITEKKALMQQLLQSQKMEAMGRLAGGVAHDFNNLLTIISGYSEFLMEVLPKNDGNREAVEAISEASTRAAGLTRQLLAFSRKSILDPQVLCINQIVRETEKMLRRMIGEDIQLTTELDDTIPNIKVDPGQLTQVLLNLSINARDAMPGGGQLTIETSSVKILPADSDSKAGIAPGSYVRLILSDTGCGMSEETKSHIFEPFFTTKEEGKGTGLGLATVFGIIEQSKGYIEVDSSVGVGTSFRIYFPTVEEESKQTTSNSLPNYRGEESILFVEDEEGVRAFGTISLQSCGYNVIPAEDAARALEIVSKNSVNFQILVTDVVMPGMHGPELAKILCAMKPELKVLFLSGYTDDALIRAGLHGHTVSLLQKPFTLQSLASKVRDVLDSDHVRQNNAVSMPPAHLN